MLERNSLRDKRVLNIGRMQGDRRLAERRRKARQRFTFALFLLIIILLGSAVYGLWKPGVRISQVTVSNGDDTLAALAQEKLTGTYAHVIPRDSIFFAARHEIRAAILAGRADIAAVSISRDGFTGLIITPSLRTPIGRWCGLGNTPGVAEYCYLFDANGYVYAAVDVASTTKAINSFVLYDPLAGTTEEPLRATLANADKLPAAFDFARQVSTLGSPVVAVTIRNDEVDDLLQSGTRITYILGNESHAYNLLVASKTNLNLSDGSITYIDLRFDDKVYLKRKNDTVGQ